jgi:hypothetical protein
VQSTNLDWLDHGTAMFGEIVANDNTIGTFAPRQR